MQAFLCYGECIVTDKDISALAMENLRTCTYYASYTTFLRICLKLYIGIKMKLRHVPYSMRNIVYS